MSRPMESPLKSIRPGTVAFWMLNDASTPAEKIDYLRACKAGGFEAATLHCRSGNLTPYASRAWFDTIIALVEEGHRLDMEIWLYDEDPFPSGAGGGLVMAQRPELAARGMVWHECPSSCKPGSLWAISPYPVLWAGLVSNRAPRRVHDLTDRTGPVRNEWFMCDWDSRYYYEETPLISGPRGSAVLQRYSIRVPAIPDGFRLAAVTLEPTGADSPWECLPDLLNPEAFKVFKALILDPYAQAVGQHYGKTIPGMFTDEAKPNAAFPVTPGMWEHFESQFGYALRPQVYRLFGESMEQEDIQVRIDFRRWVLKRFLDVFVYPYRKYCDASGLRLIGHFSPEDDPVAETCAVGSVMPVMQAMSGPGTDLIIPLVGDGKSPTLNLGSLRASSVRSRYGAGFCMSESLGCSPWGITTWESRRILAWQKVLGIDRLFIHGFFMSSEGVNNYEAPPDFGPHSSIFAGMGVMNDWIRRMEQCMDGADEQAPVAVLNSLYSFWAEGNASTGRLLAIRRSMWQTLLSALSSQVGIHLVDESEFSGAVEAKDGQFRVGDRSYRVLLVPDYDIVGQPAWEAMHRMVKAGVRVVHFGRGPSLLLPARGALYPCPDRPGEKVRAPWPSAAWCRRELPRQVRLSGPGTPHVFVRRFADREHRDRLLAVNLHDAPQEVRLGTQESGKGACWTPVEVDGEVRLRSAGTVWQIPGGGCGLFELSTPAMALDRHTVARASRDLAFRTLMFKRMDPNRVRLCRTEVTWNAAGKGQGGTLLPYPKPYWRCTSDYRVSRVIETFGGPLPLESTPSYETLTYRFAFTVKPDLVAPMVLLMDPRCARGQCDVALNGRMLRRGLVFPLDGIQPLRIPLRRALKRGGNELEVSFTLCSALDGMLSQLYLEGDFDLEVSGTRLLVSRARHAYDAAGWQLAGLAHYMGGCRYQWTEQFSEAELASGSPWILELDRVIDSAQCVVNGRSQGSRAWLPWRWDLHGLRPGPNRFELMVHGTAGNLHTLEWPGQAQGWIGGGRLLMVGQRP